MPAPFPAPRPTTRELPDPELARRIAGGEPELFELLMRRHNQRLFRVVRGVVDDDGEAEDVLQDAWVRAFEHLGEFRGEAAFTTWVTRIALHEAWARMRKGRRFVALEPEREDALTATGEEPESAAASGERDRPSSSPMAFCRSPGARVCPSAMANSIVDFGVTGLSLSRTISCCSSGIGSARMRSA